MKIKTGAHSRKRRVIISALAACICSYSLTIGAALAADIAGPPNRIPPEAVPTADPAYQVFILGAVKRPAAIPFRKGMTILEALNEVDSSAPGPTPSSLSSQLEDRSDLFHATLRHKDGTTIPIDLDQLFNHGAITQNLALQGGDLVYVPRQLPICILGAVTHPGEYYIRDWDKDRVLDLLQQAGGQTVDAREADAFVGRTANAGPVIWTPLHLDKILRKGMMKFNIKLKPLDILWVPKGPPRPKPDFEQHDYYFLLPRL